MIRNYKKKNVNLRFLNLSELIKECLEKEYGDFALMKVQYLSSWRAGYNYSEKFGFEIDGEGKTPEEAVVKLLLKLLKE